MSIRSCATCGAPLEAADVVCLLGHRVSPTPISDIAELRAKVDEAFAAAEAQLRVLTGSAMTKALPDPVDPAPYDLPTPPAPAPQAPYFVPLAPAPPPAAPAPETFPSTPIAPEPPMVSAPPPAPPPPPPPAPVLYKPLPVPEDDRLDDPIAAFAPAARLDWGPEKTAASRAAELRRRFNK